MAGAMGIGDRDDLYIVTGDQLGGTFVSGNFTAFDDQILPRHQSGVLATADRTRHVGTTGHLIQLALLARRALLHLAEEAVIVVGRRLQRQVGRCTQVGLITRTDLAGDQPQVLAGGQHGVTTRRNAGRHLLGMVLLASHLPRLVIDMLLIRRRGQRQVARGSHGNITLGIDLAGDGRQVSPRSKRNVTPGRQRRAELGELLSTVALADTDGIALFGGNQVDVATGNDLGITAALQHTALAGHVTAGTHD